MYETIMKYFIYFMIYSIIGWFVEVSDVLYCRGKFVNRGFLIGPYVPIYGIGSVVSLLVVGKSTDNPILVFLSLVFIFSVLEYFISFIMEKMFGIRWWDYSKRHFNVNGRVCLENMILFGILGFILIYFVHPIITALVNKISFNYLIIISCTLFIIFVIDIIVSLKVTYNIKGSIKTLHADSTENVNIYTKKWLEKNSVIYKRVEKAFPVIKNYFNKELEEIKNKI